MYTTSSVAPVFIVHQLAKESLLQKGSKIVLISSEAGSIALRTGPEGNYAHHASKAALNMTGKLLSYDLKDQGVVVSMVHPGFMRTEMTRGVGFDKFWDQFHGTFSLLRWPLSVANIDSTMNSCNTRRGGEEPNDVGGPARHF